MITISTRATPGFTKSDRLQLAHFTHYRQLAFSKLIGMLEHDFVYSPFGFIGYARGTNNVCTTATFIAIDVDDTTIPLTERHQQLIDEDLTHLIATTSDPTNPLRYRILFPLDQPVTADGYRDVVRGVRDLGLVTDLDFGSSVKVGGFMFSYSGSTVLSYLTGINLSVSDYSVKPEQVNYSAMDPTQLLESFDQQFGNCSRAMQGNRTRTLLMVAFQLVESGATKEQLVAAVLRVNQSFLMPKQVSEVQRRVINFILGKHKLRD